MKNRLSGGLIALTLCASPHPSWALGGKTSGAASGTLQAHTVMVLGSRGSACSGTIVAPTVILTAGHCAVGSPQLAVAYYDGEIPVLKNVVQTAAHPQYSGGNLRSMDLALVRLAFPLPARFSPVALVDESASEAETRYTLAGFGLQTVRNEASAGKLRSADVEALPLSTSRVLHLSSGGPDMEQMSANVQVCKGDSGGPVFVGGAGGLTLAGVIFATYNTGVKPGAKWSAICGNTAQAIRLGPQRAWIEGVLAGWR